MNTDPLARNIWGIRQMDDLTLFIVHNKNDPHTQHDNERIKHQIQHEVYRGGLEAEIQEPEIDTEDKYVHQFAGHEIHTHKNLSDIYTTTLNVNKQSVRENGTQHKTRYPNMYTYANQHSKRGNIIGSIHRIRTQNTYRRDFTQATEDLIAELRCINYTQTTIKKCIYKLTRRPEWKTILQPILAKLTNTPNKITPDKARTTPKRYRHAYDEPVANPSRDSHKT
jgi:hypothetical protein